MTTALHHVSVYLIDGDPSDVRDYLREPDDFELLEHRIDLPELEADLVLFEHRHPDVVPESVRF